MVIVDTNADSYANQPLNAVAIKPWQVYYTVGLP